MSGPTIDRAAVARLGELAQLALDEAELDRTAAELASIVGYAADLAAVDVVGVPPMDRPFAGEATAMRDDAPGVELDRALALAEAPRAHDGGFDVPAFVDEG